MAIRTYVILDGLADPLHGRELSARWKAAGYDNAVDPAGQAAWLERAPVTSEPEAAKKSDADPNAGSEELSPQEQNVNQSDALTEQEVAVAGAIARGFGVEIRDRAGKTFVSENDLPAVREQMTYEYRTRFAQAVVFGLPALCTHYLAPILAMGGGQSSGNMAYPWLFEMVLVGWALWAAGLPILWGGLMSLIHLRATSDLFVLFLVTCAFVPSAFGVVSLLWTDTPWFGSAQGIEPGQSGGGPMFHVAMWAVMIALCQRHLMYRRLPQLSGKANRMLPRIGRLVRVWMLLVIAIWIFMDWQSALAVGLLLPPVLSVGGVNNWSPGWSIALPVFAFAPVLLFGPRGLDLLAPAAGARVEIAGLFGLLMTVVFAKGWKKLPVAADGFGKE